MAIGGVGVIPTLGLTALGSVENYTFAVMPVFSMMGELADISGMMREAYGRQTFCWGDSGWFGHGQPGGGRCVFTGQRSSLACSAINDPESALPQLNGTTNIRPPALRLAPCRQAVPVENSSPQGS
jgi:hypothetical protein